MTPNPIPLSPSGAMPTLSPASLHWPVFFLLLPWHSPCTLHTATKPCWTHRVRPRDSSVHNLPGFSTSLQAKVKSSLWPARPPWALTSILPPSSLPHTCLTWLPTYSLDHSVPATLASLNPSSHPPQASYEFISCLKTGVWEKQTNKYCSWDALRRNR